MPCGLGIGRAGEKRLKFRCQSSGTRFRKRQNAAKSKRLRSMRVVRLIERHGDQQLGTAGSQGLGQRAGASLVQIYTGLIYQGPDLVRQILTALRE